MKICTVIGARPQFIKHAALEFAMASESSIKHIVIHTGQHYDENMSDVFFSEFHLKKPDYMLDIRSHSHGKQTALMLIEIEQILLDTKPDYLIVYGDTNSTLAGALAAKKLHIKVIHIEAGLRSFNMNMPEEVNRVMTDRISDILFAPSQLAMDHLHNEGLSSQSVLIGDVMKDMVKYSQEKRIIKADQKDEFYYATIHRPYNTDAIERLTSIFETLNELNKRVIFSLHPRTKHLVEQTDLALTQYTNIQFIDPVSYFENLNYINGAVALLTDSGGMQKEAYWLETKCITIRKETEWTETLEEGWNHLVYDNLNEIHEILLKTPRVYNATLYGDGEAAKKIVEYLKRLH